ncbi:unnamed protein product [Miscanthus lutarioriparius]|uniref:Uncharacterized protein n=1 Tax=Miscanthus lutarioriparius TaxID=422564 RepID=A0A811PCC5_9POAL|nr:unnamed protein product [Miscanthus lutarioriparius]
MAIPVARVHLAMAQAALPALLPTPPKWKMMPLLPTPCVATILGLPKPLGKPSRADSDERWDTRKTKPARIESSAASSPRSADDSVRSSAGRGSSRKNATSPPPKPGRADSVERWDAHKKAASPASSSSSGTSPLISSTCTISRASSAERWDVHKHKKRRPPWAKALDDGESSSSAVLAATTWTRRRRYYGSRGPCTQDRASSSPRQNPACFPCQHRSWFALHSCTARIHLGWFLQLPKASVI